MSSRGAAQTFRMPSLDTPMYPNPERASLSTSVPKLEMPSLETASISLFDADENAVIPATILVVDSEEINRRLLKAIFKTSPYKILEAHKRPRPRRCWRRKKSTW